MQSSAEEIQRAMVEQQQSFAVEETSCNEEYERRKLNLKNLKQKLSETCVEPFIQLTCQTSSILYNCLYT